MIYLIAYVALVACVASTTRLAQDDEITAPWRHRLREKHGQYWFWNRMLECARCTSVWTAIPWTILAGAGAIGFGAVWWHVLVLSVPCWWATAYLAYLMILKGEN